MPAKNSNKKVSNAKSPEPSQSTNSNRTSVLKWCFITFLKLCLISIFTLAIYAIYLDSKVRRTFEGQRWQVPVQVYGKIPHYQIGMAINLTHVKERLLLTGYQKVAQVKVPGQFAMSASRLIIFQRSFDYGHYQQDEQLVTIEVSHNIVDKILAEGVAVSAVDFEPVLIDRIIPENKEDRVLLGLEEVPEQLIDMLLLVEDRDFYHHHGVSPVGVMRALISNIKAGRTVQGGSTLTQQLVKNMFLTRQKTLWRKLNEAIMALILEYRYSKDQLLEAYFNEVYLGQHYANGIYGFGLAAEFYFGKKIHQLNTEQMATLVGQIKGPSYYDPWRYPERAVKRRDLILTMAFQQQSLSKNEFEHAVNSPLSIRKSRRIVKQKNPAYLQLVKRELSDLLSEQEQQAGVKVFTGFDVRQQTILNNSIDRAITELEFQKQQANTQVAMLVSDHHTGEVTAMLGGRNQQYAAFNRALHAKRPIGSLIKPIVYVAALERSDKYTLATKLDDKPLAITMDDKNVWRPKNYDGKFRQSTTLHEALVRSFNVPTVNLGLALGLPTVIDFIHALGYEHEINFHPSLLLGSLNMSPFDVQQLYLALANKGVTQKNHAINTIYTDDGELIFDYNAKQTQKLSSQAWYLLHYALNDVTKTGSAKSLSWRLPNAQVAGKTGTSNDQRDSWFVGYDNQYLVTAWVGQDDNKKTAFTGSSGALVLFAEFMKKNGVENIDLTPVSGISDVWFDNESGAAYQSRCGNSTVFPANTYVLKQQSKCKEKHEEDKNWFERWFLD